MTDYKQLCAELLQAWNNAPTPSDFIDTDGYGFFAKIQAALAETEPDWKLWGCTTMTELSPAAQTVRRDFAQIMHELYGGCRVSISSTITGPLIITLERLPITLETNDASLQAGINSLCAAALRAAVAATQMRQYEDCSIEALGWFCEADELLTIAAELDGANSTS